MILLKKQLALAENLIRAGIASSALWSLLCLFILLQIACTPSLEREGVPLWVGINLEQPCTPSVLQDNLIGYQQIQADGWMIEIPFRPEAASPNGVFKYYEHFALDTLLPMLEDQQMPYSLAFTLENPRSLPPATLQIEHWLTDISGILLRTNTYPPRHLVFMGEFVRSEYALERLRSLLAELPHEFPGFNGSIMFADYPEFLLKEFDWQTPDMIGVRHQSPPDENFREYFRRVHSQLGYKLMETDKGVMIVQTNLLGEKKDLLFRNQLRFWPEGIDLQGIVLNTLYCRISILDSTSHFALKHERKLLDFLEEY